MDKQLQQLQATVASIVEWIHDRERQLIKNPLDVPSQGVIYRDVPLYKGKSATKPTPLALTQKTTTGGAATETFSIPGIIPGDLVFTQVVNPGTNIVSIVQADVIADDTAQIVFSDDPIDDTVVNFVVFRPTGQSTKGVMTFEINGNNVNLLYD